MVQKIKKLSPALHPLMFEKNKEIEKLLCLENPIKPQFTFSDSVDEHNGFGAREKS